MGKKDPVSPDLSEAGKGEERKMTRRKLLWEGNMHVFPWKQFIGVKYKMYKAQGAEQIKVYAKKEVER
jgi:hypothetical protein